MDWRWWWATLKELVEQLVGAQLRGVGLADPIGREEGGHPGRTEIALDAARGLGQVVVAVRHPAASEVDKPAQRPVGDHHIGQTVVAVDEHRVFVVRAGGVQLGQQRRGAAADSLSIEVIRVDGASDQIGRSPGQIGVQAQVVHVQEQVCPQDRLMLR